MQKKPKKPQKHQNGPKKHKRTEKVQNSLETQENLKMQNRTKTNPFARNSFKTHR